MSKWIVIVERLDEDPYVVGFGSRDFAGLWCNEVNDLAEKAWPNSYHNFARVAVQPDSPGDVWRRIQREAERP